MKREDNILPNGKYLSKIAVDAVNGSGICAVNFLACRRRHNRGYKGCFQ
jgi:hypothetical protein